MKTTSSGISDQMRDITVGDFLQNKLSCHHIAEKLLKMPRNTHKPKQTIKNSKG